jgi:hypothetical protein
MKNHLLIGCFFLLLWFWLGMPGCGEQEASTSTTTTTAPALSPATIPVFCPGDTLLYSAEFWGAEENPFKPSTIDTVEVLDTARGWVKWRYLQFPNQKIFWKSDRVEEFARWTRPLRGG